MSLVFLSLCGYIVGMDKQAVAILVKSSPSGGGVSTPETFICPLCDKSYTPNAVTIMAHKEAQDIMSGKKRTKTYRSAEEFLAELKA
jgi:hypothetical protein